VNELRHRAPNAITEAEVDAVISAMESGATLDECKEKFG
jgi:hypothetical protein